jgi:hypothetical protein
MKVVSFAASTWIWTTSGLRRLADILSVDWYFGFVPTGDIRENEIAANW